MPWHYIAGSQSDRKSTRNRVTPSRVCVRSSPKFLCGYARYIRGRRRGHINI